MSFLLIDASVLAVVVWDFTPCLYPMKLLRSWSNHLSIWNKAGDCT